MKRSELTFTGDYYRLTPDTWGDTSVMIDESEAQLKASEMFGCSISEAHPDKDPNNPPREIEIATDKEGNFYAVEEKSNWFYKCEDPEKCGAFSYCWNYQEFEEEEQEEE